MKEDEIDFDYKNFKDACINTHKSATQSGPEILKSLRMLKRNLLLHFDMDRTVNARVIKNLDDKLNQFYGVKMLMAKEYSNRAKNRRGASFWQIKSADELCNDQVQPNDPEVRQQWLQLN